MYAIRSYYDPQAACHFHGTDTDGGREAQVSGLQQGAARQHDTAGGNVVATRP